MGKFIARLVVTLALLYGAGATAFAFLHYGGEKPDVPTILKDFNGWITSLWAKKANPKPAQPVEPPAPVPVTPPAPTPVEEPEPAEPVPTGRVVPKPPPHLSGEQLELWKIENLVLPDVEKQARALRDMSRADAPAFEAARTTAMATLGDARTFLSGMIDRNPDHDHANRLWQKLQGIYAALKKL